MRGARLREGVAVRWSITPASRVPRKSSRATLLLTARVQALDSLSVGVELWPYCVAVNALTSPELDRVGASLHA